MGRGVWLLMSWVVSVAVVGVEHNLPNFLQNFCGPFGHLVLRTNLLCEIRLKLRRRPTGPKTGSTSTTDQNLSRKRPKGPAPAFQPVHNWRIGVALFAKSLIYKDSLFPVMSITGNSESARRCAVAFRRYAGARGAPDRPCRPIPVRPFDNVRWVGTRVAGRSDVEPRALQNMIRTLARLL